MFNINNFTIYKVLYYLSGLVVPILVTINSLNKFTYYKFNNTNTKTNTIRGKLLLLTTITFLTTLAFLISNYVFINLKLINFFLSNNEYLVKFNIYIQILIVLLISTFLIFKKTKILLKKIILINFLIFSTFSWYSQINNSFLIDVVPFHIFKSVNMNIFNVIFLLAIETVFYLWTYISYNSRLSDWKVPKLCLKDFSPILNIAIFYLLIMFYYSLLFK